MPEKGLIDTITALWGGAIAVKRQRQTGTSASATAALPRRSVRRILSAQAEFLRPSGTLAPALAGPPQTPPVHTGTREKAGHGFATEVTNF